jgi:hypothetical protein
MNNRSNRRSIKLWQIPIVVLLCALILVIAPLAIIFYLLRSVCLRIAIWSSWCTRGKDVLFVYSDSTIWQDYIEGRILPYLDERAVILNWSQRKRWSNLLSKMHFATLAVIANSIRLRLFSARLAAPTFSGFGSHFTTLSTGIQKHYKRWKQTFSNCLVSIGSLATGMHRKNLYCFRNSASTCWVINRTSVS